MEATRPESRDADSVGRRLGSGSFLALEIGLHRGVCHRVDRKSTQFRVEVLRGFVITDLDAETKSPLQLRVHQLVDFPNGAFDSGNLMHLIVQRPNPALDPIQPKDLAPSCGSRLE